MASEPTIPADELAAHGAAVDARIEELMGNTPDEDALESIEAEDEAELDEESAELDEYADADESDETPAAHSKVSLLRAWAALERDGWSEEQIEALGDKTVLSIGLARAKSQDKNDEVYAERDRYRSKNGMAPVLDSNEEKPGASDPAQDARASDPTTAGVDLTSLAGPVSAAIAEMNDPEEIAAHLASFVGKAVSQAVAEERKNSELSARALRAAEGRFEGDINEVKDLAMYYRSKGRHGDKEGLARFDALIEDAVRSLGTAGVTQNNNTSPAPLKRGARRPSGSKTPPPKSRTEDELFSARLARIEAGERDVSKLRAMK